jgi:hypothetical protein
LERSAYGLKAGDGLGGRLERAQAVKQILSSRYFFWALLALPALPMLIALSSDPGAAEGLLHPSGEFSARFMIIAMMITPLRMIFPKASWPNWLMRRRRALGVAAFLYAVLHLVLYVLDKGALAPMLAEFMESRDLDRVAGIRHLRAAGTDQQQHLATLVADQMEDAAAVRLSGCSADACALDLRARQSRAGTCQLPAAGGP